MKEKQDTEEDRIRNAVEEADAKRAAEEAEKARKTQAMFQSMANNRTEQVSVGQGGGGRTRERGGERRGERGREEVRDERAEESREE